MSFLLRRVRPEQILFGTDFPAISLDMARWYTDNVDPYFGSRPQLHAQVMHGNAHTLIPRLNSSSIPD